MHIYTHIYICISYHIHNNSKQGITEEIAIVTARYRREMTERKKLHNIIQELKGNIRVYMRCRPPTKKELEQFGKNMICRCVL